MHQIDLTRRPQGRKDLAEWYAAALEEQESSGMSVADFADELGVSPATLYLWKRRFAAEKPRAPGSPCLTGLIEVFRKTEPLPAAADAVVIRLGSGRCIEVPKHFDDRDLVRLVEILESC